MDALRKCIICQNNLPVSEFDVKTSVGEKKKFNSVCRGCLREMSENDGAFDDDESLEDRNAVEILAVALVSMVEHDVVILQKISRDDVVRRMGEDAVSGIDFEEARKKALELIAIRKGYDMAEDVKYGPGVYVVFGESYGRYMDDGMFRLCKNLVEQLGARPIHVGHMTDGYGAVSRIAELPDLIVVPMKHEFLLVRAAAEEYGFDIAMNCAWVGPVMVANQNYRGENTVSSSATIRINERGARLTVVNRNSHEMHTACSEGSRQIFWTTGCLAEPHQTKKPKKGVSTDPEKLDEYDKDASFTGRRQKEVSEISWEQGCVIVTVAPDEHPTVYAARIKKTRSGYTTCYYDRIITETGVETPDETVLVVGDAHVDHHDPRIMATVQSVARAIKPDHLVNVGDHWDMRSLNHHALDRGEPTGKCVVEECGRGFAVLEKMGLWAPKRYVFVGNHERWLDRFTAKNPQLAKLLEFATLTSAESAGYEVYPSKEVMHLANATFYHGDMKMFGGRGDRHEKASKVLGPNSICGHSHSPSIRKDAYVVGFLGLFDQEYNEPQASMWAHGFGIVSAYDGVPFISSIPVFDYRVMVHSKECTDRGWEEWNMPEYEVEIIYHPKRAGKEDRG